MFCDEEQLKALFNLTKNDDRNTTKNYCKNASSYDSVVTDELERVVPDVLNEFSDIVDTQVFKQPFSVRKYKNLIPKSKTRKRSVTHSSSNSNKQSKQSKTNYKKEFLTYESPCSPSLSVDSAIDLSADNQLDIFMSGGMNHSLKFPADDNSDLELNFDVMEDMYQTESINTNISAKDFKFCTKKQYSVKKRKLEEDLVKIPSKRTKLNEDSSSHIHSIFDILCSDLETLIPIHIEKEIDYAHCSLDKNELVDELKILIPRLLDADFQVQQVGPTLNVLDIFYGFNFDEPVPLILDSGESEHDKVDFTICKSLIESKDIIVDSNFTATLMNLVCDSSPLDNVKNDQIENMCADNSVLPEFEVCNDGCVELQPTDQCDIEQLDNGDHSYEENISESFNNNHGECNASTFEIDSEVVVLPRNIAVRTSNFIVDDEKLPKDLLALLDHNPQTKDTSNIVSGGTAKNNELSSQYNFTVNLLRMYSAGVLEIDSKSSVHEPNRTEILKKSTFICSRKIVKKCKRILSKRNILKTKSKIHKSVHISNHYSPESNNSDSNQDDVLEEKPCLKRRFRYAKVQF